MLASLVTLKSYPNLPVIEETERCLLLLLVKHAMVEIVVSKGPPRGVVRLVYYTPMWNVALGHTIYGDTKYEWKARI